MNKTLLHSEKVSETCPSDYDYLTKEIFYCPEESQFYAQCLERMVLNICEDYTSIAEFGAGDGSPVINTLLKSSFNGFINGYELNAKAAEVAQFRIDRYKLRNKYVVHNSCFSNCASADYLIANPPYIPAIDNNIYLPALHGGKDGADITKMLFEGEFPNAMLMISGYSDPVGTIEHAIAKGYQVEDFLTSPMSFGCYSSEPKVKQRISELQEHGKAFYSQNVYILAGVLFHKGKALKADLTPELIKIMTAL
jgi:methylase of polypeptide subunit release factors